MILKNYVKSLDTIINVKTAMYAQIFSPRGPGFPEIGRSRRARGCRLGAASRFEVATLFPTEPAKASSK